jgi:hypothetical protein
MKFTREILHAKGFRNDGRGGLVRLPESEWRERQVNFGGGVVPGAAPCPSGDGAHPDRSTRSSASIRVPRQRHPNATEERWFLSAKARWPGLEIRYEAISFRLNSGAKYTPDFSGWDHGCLLWCCEVKGSWKFPSHSRSVLALKTAADEWRDVKFFLAMRKDGEWIETPIDV